MAEKKKKPESDKQPIEQAEDWASREVSGDEQQVTQPGPVYTNPNEDEKAE